MYFTQSGLRDTKRAEGSLTMRLTQLKADLEQERTVLILFQRHGDGTRVMQKRDQIRAIESRIAAIEGG